MKKLNKYFKYLLYVMPAVLCFSYEPVMHFGSDVSMNFELSIPLIWLVLFDVLVFVMMVKKKILLKGLKQKWVWLLFPVWLSVSVLWSLNFVRGVLTIGILWLLYLAGYGIWQFRKLLDKEFWRVFLKWFFGASLVVCAVCVLQCVLDLVGVTREWTLMCAGCTYRMFGFPHPDGFAIEPQFMGNLLLAPALAATWLLLEDGYNSTLRTRVAPARRHGRSALFLGRNLRTVLRVLLLAVFTSTLFLTFSRGAIYAFVVGLIVMSVWMVVEAKVKWRDVLKRVGLIWGVVVLCFVVVLNIQGLMAAVSPTNDTYKTGVAKVLNHLSLGVIEIGDDSPAGEDLTGAEVVENSVEKSGIEQAVYDGYVKESTDTRLRLSGAAVQVWSKDLATVVFGVGLGGAGQALYINNLSPAPKEIVQNQYASLILETGVVGISLLILTIILIVRTVMKFDTRGMIFSLLIAFAISLCFFSGLPNALHIYLLPMVLLFFLW